MSGIGGIFHRDGRPLDPGDLEQHLSRIAHRGPDGSGTWHDGPAGLGHQMLHTTPEAVGEVVPLTSADGSLVLTYHGRVDDREALGRDLVAAGARLRTDTDGELLLQAYACWGEAFPARILGDFALAIWDARRRQLFCARDILGVKPFYYHLSDRLFVCGSELRQVVEHPDVPDDINEGMIGERLAHAAATRDETFRRAVLRLPPAHAMVVTAGGCRTRAYWDIDTAHRPLRGSREECIEQFLSLVREAVRSRARAPDRIGVFLSGGIDSGIVTAALRELLGPAGFRTFSAVYPGLTCDEQAQIEARDEVWGLRSTCVPHRSMTWAELTALASTCGDFPAYPNTMIPLRKAAADDETRVILTGLGGDDWMTMHRRHYADLVSALRFAPLLARFRRDVAARGLRSGLHTVLNQGVRRLLPTGLRRVYRQARSTLRTPGRVRSWIPESFSRRIGLRDRLRFRERDCGSLPYFFRDMYYWFHSPWLAGSMEINERVNATLGIETRHPLNDRRIIEFGMRLPQAHRCHPTEAKPFLQSALWTLSPAVRSLELSRPGFGDVFVAELAELGGSHALSQLACAARGWVDADVLSEMYATDPDAHGWVLGEVFGVELWLQTC